MPASDAASSEIEHVSCRCLNVAATIRVRQREGRIIKGTLVDELQKQVPSLVSYVQASASSGGEERASKILCANCDVQVLEYDAEAAPLQAGTDVTVDTRDSDKSALTGSGNIDKLRKDSDKGWSDLFNIIIAVPSENDGDAAGEPGGPGPATMKRSSSRDLQASAMASSIFHDKARARIKKDKQELEAQIIRMRAEHDAATRKYLTQADMLAERARTATSALPRSTSTSSALPAAAKQTAAKASRTLSPRPSSKGKPTTEASSPPLIVQRGGFDTPPVASTSSSATSPKSPRITTGSLATGIPASISAALAAGSSQSITSPTLTDDAASYPGLFGAINGKTPSLPTQGKVSPGPVPSSAIAQPSGPQSPSMRRSRSPSPSTTNRTASQSRERASDPNRIARGQSKDTNTSSTAATSGKRPALNLDRDVARQDAETSRASEEDARRGRTSNTSNVNMSTSVPRTTHTALSQNPGKNAPAPKRTTSSWLRLNGISPSPPAVRQGMVQSQTTTKAETPSPDKGKGRAEEPKSSPEAERPSAPKRHVSFKEPEPPKHAASPKIEHEILEAEETPFELDEEMEDQSDDKESDTEDNVDTSIAAALSGAEAKNRPNTKAYGSTAAASSSPRANSHSPGPKTIIGSLSASLQSGKGAQSLAAMLNDPSSFIGSLRNANHMNRGSANPSSYAGPSSYSQTGGSDESNSGSGSLSGNNAVRLNEQSRRMRDLLGVDAPSHRGRRSKGAQTLQQMLAEEEDTLTDEQLDILAPVSNLATSLPVAIGIPRFNKKEEYEFERKTSVPQKEGLLVPKFKNRKLGAELPVLEEAEERSTSPQTSEQSVPNTKSDQITKGAVDVPGAEAIQQAEMKEEVSRMLSDHSPPVPKGDATSAREDVQTAILAENDAERGRTKLEDGEQAEGESQDVDGKPQGGFVPPHVWSRKTAGDLGMLGTSVYDYD